MSSGRWSDLLPRVISGVVMVVVGFGAMLMGADVFHVFVALICGAMLWELTRMLAPEAPKLAYGLGLAGGGLILASIYLPASLVFLDLLALPLLGFAMLKRGKGLFVMFALLICFAGFALMAVRDNFGLGWMLWLAGVVIATDVAGYFVGKTVGGPKLWPRVSPNKTWSGTIGGWAGAVLVAVLFILFRDVGPGVIAVSVAASMAAQMGDIAESALKRRVGVKDSSNLIPGHGGLMDRFDGMLGASIFVLILVPVLGLAQSAG